MKTDYPVTLLCELLDLPRSSFYYSPTDTTPEPALVTAIEHLLARWPFLGYRRVVHYLRRDGWQVGECTVRQILQEMKRSRSAGRLITTDSRHTHQRYPNQIRDLVPLCPNHIWVADITYLRYGRQYLYLAVILDAYTRAVRGWQLEEFLSCQALTLPALTMALQQGTPAVFHSDQGRQYAAREHVELLTDAGVVISMSDAGSPTQNALMERFIRTLKDEFLPYADYTSPIEMRRQLRHFLEIEYYSERIHSSLGYLTPREFEELYYQPQLSQFA